MLSSVSIKVRLEEEVVVYSSPYLEKMNEVLPKHSVRSAYRCNRASEVRRDPQQLTTANMSFQNYAELPHVAAHHRQGQQLESPFQRRQSPLQEGTLTAARRLFQSACYIISNSCPQTLYGTTAEDAWWRECVRYVQSSMENAVGALYVRETFAGESKQMVSDRVQSIGKLVFESRVPIILIYSRS